MREDEGQREGEVMREGEGGVMDIWRNRYHHWYSRPFVYAVKSICDVFNHAICMFAHVYASV